MQTTKTPLILTIATPLAGALLLAWDNEQTIEGELALQDALRMDAQRIRYAGITSVAITL